MENGNGNVDATTDTNRSRNGEYVTRGGGEDASEDADEYEEVDSVFAIASEHDDDDYGSKNIFAGADVRIPRAVVSEGVKILREALDATFIFEDAESNNSQPANKERQEGAREQGDGLTLNASNNNSNGNGGSSGPRSALKGSAEKKPKSKSKGQENGDTKKDRKGKGTR
jgi:hypothetical protein